MKINIITNLDPRKGLRRDFDLLKRELERLGHKVHGVSFQSGVFTIHADLNIFCETLMAEALHTAPRNWYIPNPEWHFPQYDALKKHIELVLCKTADAARKFSDWGDRVRHTGFVSEDRYIPTVNRRPVFLHAAGTSQVKNTQAVLDCWRWFKPAAQLIVCGEYYRSHSEVPNVETFTHLPDEEFRVMQNRCLYHLIPSQYEGWGHALHEAMSVGAHIITTDAEPMRSVPSCKLVRVFESTARCRANMYRVNAEAVLEAIEPLLSSDDRAFSPMVRNVFLAERDSFAQSLEKLLAGERMEVTP